MKPQYLLVNGRTGPVVAKCRSNGTECLVAIVKGKPRLVPVARAVEAPPRTKPRLVWKDGARI